MFTDVDTPVVHCQRHIHVYHFVYLRPTQGAHEFSIWITLRGRGECFVAFDCYSIRGDTLEGGLGIPKGAWVINKHQL